MGCSFGQRGHDEGLVPPAIVPCAGVGDLAVALLPHLRFLAGADQGERCAGHNGNVGASHDFEQAKRVRDFFVAPLVSANDRDPQYFDLRRLDHDQQRLHVAAAGAGAILVDDDFAAGLGCRGENGRREAKQREEEELCS